MLTPNVNLSFRLYIAIEVNKAASLAHVLRVQIGALALPNEWKNAKYYVNQSTPLLCLVIGHELSFDYI